MLLQKTIDGRYQFSLPATTWENQTLLAKVHACENPVCECHTVDILFYSDDEFVGEASPHLNDEEFFAGSSNVNLSADVELVRAFEQSMTKEDWKLLRELYIRIKRTATERIDVDTQRVSFPMADDIERNGELVSFTSILPYGESFLSERESDVLLLDDQYCLRPGCKCTRAFASFITIKDLKQVPGDPPAVFVDYETGSFEVELEGSPHQDPGALLEISKLDQPDLLKKFKERHAILRSLYRTFRMIQGAPSVRAAPKVGRNDRCPCGSGKKFKKCCDLLDSSQCL